MNKILKKLCMIALAFVVFVGAGLTLAACKQPKDEKQVMNLSVNPSVEFILDKDDKVISVSATNEDGAYILDKFTEFTGMTAQDAALKFLELSEEYGFVVEGSLEGEEFTISVSGEGAQKLYNDVKTKVDSKLTELGLSVSEMVKTTKENLEAMVSEYYQEYTLEEVQALTEEELVNLIKNIREETKELFTDDEKQAYYRERAQKVVSAKLEAINDYLEDHSQGLNALITPFVTAMNNAYSLLESKYDQINNQMEEVYNEGTQAINVQRENYIALKKQYLDAAKEYNDALQLNLDQDVSNDVSSQVISGLKTQMETLKAEAKTLQENLEDARIQATATVLNFVKTTIHSQLTILNNQINSVLNYITLNAEDIQTAINNQITELKLEYKNNTENPWEE